MRTLTECYRNIAFRLQHTKFSVLKLIPRFWYSYYLKFQNSKLNCEIQNQVRNSKSKSNIQNLRACAQKFWTLIYNQWCPASLFLIQFLCMWWESTMLSLKGFADFFGLNLSKLWIFFYFWNFGTAIILIQIVFSKYFKYRRTEPKKWTRQ